MNYADMETQVKKLLRSYGLLESEESAAGNKSRKDYEASILESDEQHKAYAEWLCAILNNASHGIRAAEPLTVRKETP